MFAGSFIKQSGRFLKNSGWAAMAAALTVTALPAQAQDTARTDRNPTRAERSDGRERTPARPQAQRERTQGDRSFANRHQADRPQRERPADQNLRPAERPAPDRSQRPSFRPSPQQEAAPRNPQARPPQAQPPQAQPPRAETPQARPDRPQSGWQRDRDNRQDRNTTDPRRNDRPQNDWRSNGNRGNDWRSNPRRDNDRRVENRRDDRPSWQRDRSPQNNGWRAPNNNRQWNRDWRNDNRYNWSTYRQANRTLFRQNRYYAPYSNYSYSRLSIGFVLNQLFFADRYWINDPWQYRLPAAYDGYRWVRYYDDVVLVDLYSGQVVDVIYDFFW